MGKVRNNLSGFSAIEGLLILVIIGILGFTGWFVWHAKQSADKSLTSNNSTTPVIKKKAATKIVTKSTDQTASYFVVKEWGLRFKVPNGLADVKYVIDGDELGFYAKPTGSTVQYRTDYAKAVSNPDGSSYLQYATGTLYRSTASTEDRAGGSVTGKKLGNYYYYTGWAFSGLASGAACLDLYGDNDVATGCAAESTAFQLINQGDSALLNTIELAQ